MKEVKAVQVRPHSLVRWRKQDGQWQYGICLSAEYKGPADGDDCGDGCVILRFRMCNLGGHVLRKVSPTDGAFTMIALNAES